MKKYFFLMLIFAFTLSVTAMAENETTSNVGIGFFAGFGFGNGNGHDQNQPSGHHSEGMWSSPLYTGGLKLSYFATDKFSINTGISYLRLSEKVKELDQSSNTVSETEFDMNYIKVPLTFRYGNFFYVGLGGYFAMMVGPMKHDHSGMSTGINDSDIDRKDYGLSLETGLLIPLSKSFKTEIGIKMDWGLNKVVENSYQTLRNRAFYLTLGFMFF